VPAATATVTRRTADLSDDAFARELFATSRLDLAVLPAQVRDPLLDMQFRAQRLQYAESFPDAEYETLVADGVDVGQLIVDRGPGSVRIIDITVHPSQRGRGIATTVLAEELARADDAEIPVVLSVWSTNIGARRLYERLGFAVVGASDGAGYLDMQRDSTPSALGRR
jgi:ribosomal protein S18 acetylase RimI-like enzyme